MLIHSRHLGLRCLLLCCLVVVANTPRALAQESKQPAQLEIDSDLARVDRQSQTITLEGNLELRSGAQFWLTAERGVVYQYQQGGKRRFEAQGTIRACLQGIYAKGNAAAIREAEQLYTISGAARLEAIAFLATAARIEYTFKTARIRLIGADRVPIRVSYYQPTQGAQSRQSDNSCAPQKQAKRRAVAEHTHFITAEDGVLNKEEAVFVGKARAEYKAQNLTLEADRIEYYSPAPKNRAALAPNDPLIADRLVARGNVRWQQLERSGSGDQLTYLRSQNRLEVSGSAVLKDATNGTVIRVETLEVLLAPPPE